MSELTALPNTDQSYGQLTNELLEFTKIIETAQTERQQGIGRRSHPALNTAFGMLAAWNTLASDERGNNMPLLRTRVAEYLGEQGLAMRTLSHWKAPLSKMAYLAPEILNELYASLPENHENHQLLDSIDGLSGYMARKSRNSKAGKLMLGGLKYVLGSGER